ncbi:MAG: hypothetical protein FD181_1453 [Prolixibacteraceae bacterium]|nr:MAG: hypothetical protein FD181_1453 [Prolixibacteraceae bacterium]
MISDIQIPMENFWTLAIRFGFNLIATFFVVVMLYARNSKRKEFYFSYFAISVAVFMLVFLLQDVTLELGFALGLFAIFGIIRYRTDAIPIKEMTYLFVIIAVSVINALSKDFLGYLELTLVNILLVGALWILEHILMLRQEDSLQIIYENIENIHEDRENELISDLEKRTGIKIRRYRIDKVDFLRDVARITIWFYVNGSSKAKTTK